LSTCHFIVRLRTEQLITNRLGLSMADHTLPILPARLSRHILRAVRYVIYGAGGIGGTIAARLFQSGHDVVAICRGAHLQACRTKGLTIRDADATITLPIPVAGSPAEMEWRGDEAVLFTMKTQDTVPALIALRDAAGDVPIVCAQNGVANERLALRCFSRVYGMVVWMPTTHLTPGEVIAQSTPITGVLHAGCFPTGTDHLIGMVCHDLTESTFRSDPDEAIMRLKYAKLITNLANAVQGMCGDAAAGDLVRRLRDEAIQVYDAAGIDYAQGEEFAERAKGPTLKDVPGVGNRGGGSTWQSMTRGSGLETDYLNGEIVLLGALHGVPTPFNRMVQQAAAEAALLKKKPGDYTVEELMSRVG
jgi:2-dehydropantoate 2-reductase